MILNEPDWPDYYYYKLKKSTILSNLFVTATRRNMYSWVFTNTSASLCCHRKHFNYIFIFAIAVLCMILLLSFSYLVSMTMVFSRRRNVSSVYVSFLNLILSAPSRQWKKTFLLDFIILCFLHILASNISWYHQETFIKVHLLHTRF